MNTETARTLLQLPHQYNDKQLRKAYLSLSLKYHPDKNASDGSMFRKLNEAYNILDKKLCNTTIRKPNITDMHPSDLWKEYLYYVFDVDNDTFCLIQDIFTENKYIYEGYHKKM